MSKARKGLSLMLVVVMLVSLFAVMPAMNTQADAEGAGRWVAAWHGSILDMSGGQAERAVNAINTFAVGDNGTFRILLNTNLGGQEFKMTLTNYYGKSDVKIGGVTVGQQGIGTLNDLQVSTNVEAKTAAGQTSFVIPKGGSVDVYFTLKSVVPAGTGLIINIYCTNATAVRDVALYGGGCWFSGSDTRNKSDLELLGNAANLVSENEGEGDYNLLAMVQEIDVKTTNPDAYSVVFIGDSTITNSIPGMVQDNLREYGVHDVSIVSSAIKGNELLQDGAGAEQGPLEGKALVTRFNLDALQVAGVKKVFVKIGANDILHPLMSDLTDWYNGSATRPSGFVPTAQDMIDGFKSLIDQAHAAGVEIYFMDINPFMGYTRADTISWNFSNAQAKNGIREVVNEWLASNGNLNSKDTMGTKAEIGVADKTYTFPVEITETLQQWKEPHDTNTYKDVYIKDISTDRSSRNDSVQVAGVTAAGAVGTFGYIPFSSSVCADYTVKSVTGTTAGEKTNYGSEKWESNGGFFGRWKSYERLYTTITVPDFTVSDGKINEAYTTDYAHPSPAGMQLEADLIPVSLFTSAPSIADNQAKVTGLWVATNEPPTNGKWIVASNSGKNIMNTATQQGEVHLMAADLSYTDGIDTEDYRDGTHVGGFYGNAYNELGDVQTTIQRGTSAAPYIAYAPANDNNIALWTRMGQNTRIYWQNANNYRYLAFYFPSVVGGTVEEFDAGLRDEKPSNKIFNISTLELNTRTWYTIGNTASPLSSDDAWELTMLFGAAGSIAGHKYVAWGDMLGSANSKYATTGGHFRVYNTDASFGWKGGSEKTGCVTYMSKVDSVVTQLDVTDGAVSEFYGAAAGTTVPVSFKLSDNLLNVESTKVNSTVKNTTDFTVNGSTNVAQMSYAGYTYGQNQSISCTSDNEAVAKWDGSKVVLGESRGEANLVWTYSWTELDGTSYSMTASSVVYNYDGTVSGSNVVIDFGLPVQINLNALSGSRVNGINAAAPATELNTGKSAEDEFNGIKEATLTFGDAALADDGVMTYTPNKIANDKDTVYYSAKAEGGYRYSNVDIIPASNVYYEDSFISFSDNWVNDGREMLKYQSADNSIPYGYDEAYGDYTSFSMGSAMKASVADGDGKTFTASFTFTGTGFEIYSVTDASSGGAIVKYENSDGTVKKVNLINNYSKDSFYQLPCYSATGLAYDTYIVTVTVSYSKLFDSIVTPASEADGVYTPAVYKGSYSFWIDGVRIYDCAGNAFNDIYAADNEANAQYISIRQQLLTKTAAEGSDTIEGGVFVDSIIAKDNVVTSIADYKNFGPKNEVYLAKGQSVAFRLDDAAAASDIQIGAKLACAQGVGVLNVNGQKITDLKSATNMYYSIKSACRGDMIMITNTGDAVISITNLKVTHNASAAPAMIMFSMDMMPEITKTASILMAMPGTEETTEPTVEPTVEPSDEPTTEPTDEPGTQPTETPDTNPTDNPGNGDNGNNGGDNGDNGDNGDDNDNDSGNSLIKLIQKAIKLIKTAFGKVFGGKK